MVKRKVRKSCGMRSGRVVAKRADSKLIQIVYMAFRQVWTLSPFRHVSIDDSLLHGQTNDKTPERSGVAHPDASRNQLGDISWEHGTTLRLAKVSCRYIRVQSNGC
jgi:hypothetical protein